MRARVEVAAVLGAEGRAVGLLVREAELARAGDVAVAEALLIPAGEQCNATSSGGVGSIAL